MKLPKADDAQLVVLQSWPVTEQLIFDGRVRVDYHQAYLVTGEVETSYTNAFAGQSNGLLGAAQPGALVLVTGTALGDVAVQVVLHEEPPPLAPVWQDVVEASFTPLEPLVRLVTWDGQEVCTFELAASSYRARWSGHGLDVNYDGQVEPGAPETDNVFELALWPAPGAADAVLRQDSVRGREAHPPEDAGADEAEQGAQGWGTYPASPALQQRVRARPVVQLDRGLAEALAAATVGDQQVVTAWALRRACALTRLDRLASVPEALQALQDGQPMPWLFQDPELAVPLLEGEPLLRSLRRRPGMGAVFEAAQQTIRTLTKVTRLDGLDAALEAVVAAHAATVAAGKDGREVLDQMRAQLQS